MPPPPRKPEVRAALPGTMRQLIQATGMSASGLSRWIRELQTENACHVSKWISTSGRYAPYYEVGPGANVPEPKQKAGFEYSRAYRKRERKFEKPFIKARQDSIAMATSTIKSGKDAVIGDLMAGLFAKRIKRQRQGAKA